MAPKGSAIQKILEDLQAKAMRYGEAMSPLHHMLVLPAGEFLRMRSPGVRAISEFTLTRKLRTCRFGTTELVGPLPPKSCFPKGVDPFRAIVIEPQGPPSTCVPYRIHLFFGGNESSLRALSALAKEMESLKPALHSFFKSKHGIHRSGVIYSDSEIRNKRDDRIDSWLYTMHWWAWRWTKSPIHIQPKVVCAGKAYATNPLDESLRSRLSFSLLEHDVFEASAVTLALILRLLDESPKAILDEADSGHEHEQADENLEKQAMTGVESDPSNPQHTAEGMNE